MLPILSALGQQRRVIRWPVKLALFGAVLLATLYPHPSILKRHLQHIRHVEELTEPSQPGVAELRAEFEQYAVASHARMTGNSPDLRRIEQFVYARVPYDWDWNIWGVADYLPSVAEVIEKGREDCDGRAVVAAALIRSYGMEAKLVADTRHVWVRTPAGDVMHPLGKPAFQSDNGHIHINWRVLLNPTPLAFGVAVFPLLRELIILLTVWLLLIPPRMTRGECVLVLVMLCESLMLIRLAGINPVAPRYPGLAWAAAYWPAIGWMLWRCRARHDSDHALMEQPDLDVRAGVLV